ncbi:MAG: squalene--hopene cyclase [Bryobacteraceae bacterium]
MSTGLQLADALSVGCIRAIDKASRALAGRQHEDGYWWGDLTADATLEADFVLMELWLDKPGSGVWKPREPRRIEAAVRSILVRQLPDGGFSIYPGGPSDISASVKAYFALKVTGMPAEDPRMCRLRERILALGGIQAANSYVKINLSLFDLYPRQYAPVVPPEIMLMRGVIYEMSSWTRAIVIPLSIVQTAPPRPVPAGFHLDELFKAGVPLEFPNPDGLISWRNFFLSLDRAYKFLNRHPLGAIRNRAIAKAEKWMLAHTRQSDGLGAIYPPMMYALMAFDHLGYAQDHPEVREARRQFDRLLVDDGERFFFQPCFSPVWDTAIAAHALGETRPDPGGCVDRALGRCASWLLEKEVRTSGDWAVKRPGVEPSGWYFEFANEFYPDIDDSAMVLLALQHARSSEIGAQEACVARAIRWLVAMQSEDGGWAAFDADNDWQFLNHVPFADHNAMLDPTCPDITGRVLEALCVHGLTRGHQAVRRGAEYLMRTQESDGSWYGRWGVDYIYGTFLALRGLRAAGEDAREAHILRAGEWLRSVQNPDGGWGESCESYDKSFFVPAPSTASQTAWAVLGLIASGDTRSESVRRGVEYLVETQDSQGCWHEEAATGTGFPRVFYLRYHMYRDSFPLLALATWIRRQGGAH